MVKFNKGGEGFCTIKWMLPYKAIKIFTSKKSVNIHGASEKANPKKMDQVF